MKIFYGSDIHLEFSRGSFKIPKCDVLLLAGDVLVANYGEFEDYQSDIPRFFLECSNKCKNTFMIMGNHEHYNGILKNTRKNIKNILSHLNITNVHVLENDVVDIGDYMLFGATFWTDVKSNSPLVAWDIRNGLNDFSYISTEGLDTFTPYDSWLLNQYSRELLQSFLSTDYGKDKIVMTHHAPFFDSIHPRFLVRNDNISFAYANTGLEEIIKENSPKFWIHGHTHDPFEYEEYGTKVLCNPRGYVRYTGHTKAVEKFSFKAMK